MVLSVLQPDGDSLGAAGTAASGGSSNGSSYWSNVDSMLSTWHQQLGCHITVTSPDASVPSRLVELAPVPETAAAEVAHDSQPSDPAEQMLDPWLAEQLDADQEQQKQQQDEQQRSLAAATFISAGLVTGAETASRFTAATAGQASPQLLTLTQLLQQQRQQQAQRMRCGQSRRVSNGFMRWWMPSPLTCKAPARHTALHLSCSTDFLLDFAEHIYRHNAQASHLLFERHGCYAGAMHPLAEEQTLEGSSAGSRSKGAASHVASIHAMITALDTIDVLLLDVKQPSEAGSNRQGWSTLYNLLYQLHGFVGFTRSALPGGMTRLGWIRRPARFGTQCMP